jgi:hypothetical protein
MSGWTPDSRLRTHVRRGHLLTRPKPPLSLLQLSYEYLTQPFPMYASGISHTAQKSTTRRIPANAGKPNHYDLSDLPDPVFR